MLFISYLPVIQSTFLVEPESQTVDDGAVVHFFCIHGGSIPPATITWTLNGTAILPSSRINIASSVLQQTNPPQVTSTLTIIAVQRSSDVGVVRCVATNPLLPSGPVSSAPATLMITGGCVAIAIEILTIAFNFPLFFNILPAKLRKQ